MHKFFQYRLHIPTLIFLICLVTFYPRLSLDNIIVSLCFSCLGAFIYIYNKATDYLEDSVNVAALPIKSEHAKKIRYISIALLLVPILYLVQKPKLLALYLIIALIGYFYSSAPQLIGVSKRFKDIFFVKNLVIAGCWAAGIALLPVLYYNIPISMRQIIIGLNIFVFIFAVGVIGDIRDIAGDKLAGIKTLPNVIGVWPSKIIILAPTIAMLTYQLMHRYIHPIYIGAYILTILAIFLTKKDSHPLFFHAIVTIWIMAHIMFLTLKYS